ncbi:MAG: helix-hairpin-helix domain-containing protein [Cytophagaceae bacterium]|nr:helix-hairpin-helix domain-containing protein [Cytophagaceae bacterium]
MHSIKFVLSTALFLSALLARGQEYPRRELNPRELAQNLLPAPTADLDYTDLGEALYQLYLRPLDLNTCTRDELAATYILNQRQLGHFFEYRQSVGPLVSVYELQAIPEFDLPTIYRLLPFAEVRGAGRERVNANRESYLLLRYEQDLEQKKGYQTAEPNKNGTRPQRYLGGTAHPYLRLKQYLDHDVEWGITLDHDSGERLIFDGKTRRYGADFASAHVVIRNRGRWKAIILGDYQLQFGQGLALAGGFFLGKGSETVLTARRSHLGIRPYTSSAESGFMRGAAATYQAGRWEFTPFYARLRRDSNLDDDAEGVLSGSLQSSGLHRTPSEVAAKGRIVQQDYGLNALWRSRSTRGQIGFTLLKTHFDARIQKSDQAYNAYEFSGKNNFVASLQAGYLWRNTNFFGEVARSQSGGVGAVAGLLTSLNRRLDGSLVLRRYDRNFHSFYARSFGEASRNINETGLYAGLKYSPNPRWQVGGYLDVFRFPWLKYLVDKPSAGLSGLLRVAYIPRKTTQIFGQFVEEHKEKNVPDRLQKQNATLNTTRRYASLGFDHAPARRLALSTRVFYSSFRYAGFRPSQGWGLVQDGSMTFNRLTLSGRVAYFSTDDYDSRFYTYEQDVLYAFSLPAYAYEGFRNYVLLQYRLTRSLDVWVRLARTDYLHQETVSSGLEQIDAPHRTEVKAQVRWQF